MTTESPVKKFNKTVFDCLVDFKVIFGENDSDIRIMETAWQLTKVNARLFIQPFQRYISGNPIFVQNIILMNTTYFISYDYEKLLSEEQLLDDYSKKLITKFRQATIKHQNNEATLTAIYNWFKIMMYWSFIDQGKDPTREMKVQS